MCTKVITLDHCGGTSLTWRNCVVEGCRRTLQLACKSSPNAASQHCYPLKPLDFGDIRLFILLPGTTGAAIQGYIIHVSLDENPQYEALPWCWGDSKSAVPVIINEEIVSAKKNLGCALRYLRREDSARVLWIDAVCIRQNDTLERNHQVRQMREIYRRASRVVVWLGPETKLSARGLEILDKASPAKCALDHSLRKYSGASDSECVSDVLNRPWWRRMWAVQQVLLAEQAILVRGFNSIPWSGSGAMTTMKEI
jgi:hypothetical protein